MEPQQLQPTALDPFEENLENLPEEVKRFLYKGPFASGLATLAKELLLTPEQSSELRLTLLLVLSETEEKERLLDLAKQWTWNQTQTTALIQAVQTHIFSPLLEAIDYEIIDTPEESIAIPTPPIATAPSPSQALAAIKDRLTVRGAIPPSTRTYSIEKSEQGVPPSPQTKIDPYREMPE